MEFSKKSLAKIPIIMSVCPSVRLSVRFLLLSSYYLLIYSLSFLSSKKKIIVIFEKEEVKRIRIRILLH